MRIHLAASALLVMLAAPALAAGSDELAAAKAAADKGGHDEAIRLFTKAISAGDLKPEEKLAAHRGRGGEYAAKSLIADAFSRSDEAHRQRENALADFTAALQMKADDADLLATRAQVADMDGQYDKAVADFDAAIKLKPTETLLIQRATSLRGKGDYDRANADYDAALAFQPKDKGMEDADIVSERGYSNFLAGRFEAAAADFAKAISMGAAERTSDVLWQPYQTAWVHIARIRAGKDDAEQLKSEATRLDLKQWPGTMIGYFLGQTTLEQVSAGSNHGMAGRGRECALAFFTGEQALAKGAKAEATPLLQRAKEVCNVHSIYSLAANVELKRTAQ
jgi:tetratricopeptide (TPR) repeat protein